jgi:hypothetical protein
MENDNRLKGDSGGNGSGADNLEDDLFDMEKLRLSQDFGETLGVKKAIITVPVRKPNKQEFVRVRPGEDWRLETCVLTLKEDRETYLVGRGLWDDLSAEIVPTMLFTTINRQGVLTLWPVRIPSSDGRRDHWSGSALEAAEMAQLRWIRLVPNMSLGAYEPYEARADLPEPVWPEISFQDILRIAFKDAFITDLSHPVVWRLRGLA